MKLSRPIWKISLLVAVLTLLAIATYALLATSWLEENLEMDVLHALHVAWGMGTALLICALVGWLFLSEGVKPFSEAVSSQPPDRSTELKRHVRWFIYLRWLAIVLAAMLSFVATHILKILDKGLIFPLMSLVLVLALGNLVFLFLSKRALVPYRLIVLQTLFDLCILSALLHYSGGLENSLYIVFAFHVVIAAMLLRRRDSYLVTTTAAVLLSAVAFGEYSEFLHHSEIRLTPHDRPETHQRVPVEGHPDEDDGDEIGSTPELELEGGEDDAHPVREGEHADEDEGDAMASTHGAQDDEASIRHAHPAHNLTFVLGRLLPFLGILYCLTYLTQIVVTHLRRRETQLLRALGQRKRTEAQLVQAGKMAAIGELAGNFAHEVNNPVAIIGGKAKLLLDTYDRGELPDQVLSDLRKIDRHSERIARITSGLLAFSRPSLGEKKHLDVNKLIEKTLLLVEDRIRELGVRVARDLAPGVLDVRGNRNELQQVLLNLLMNALDAMEGGGVLRVTTKRGIGVTKDGSKVPTVHVSVSDSGPGITEEFRDRIFEPFFTTKEEGKGTGLGLSISQGLVRSHRGRIHIESSSDEGTTFVVTLPASDSG